MSDTTSLLRAVAISVALAPPLRGQNATLVGAVRDTAGRAIAAGEILALTSQRLASVVSGRFVLSALPAGPDIFVIRSLGFRPERLALTLAPNDTIEIEAVLQPVAQVLSQVTIEVRGKTFTGRIAEVAKRALASGAPSSSFIDRTQLERWAQFDLALVLRRAGLIVLDDHVTCPRLSQQLSAGAGTPNVAIYLDGAMLQESPRVSVDLIPVTWLEAIEVYRGNATRPVEYYSPSGACTIALWTRQ